MDRPQEWMPRNLRDDGMIEVRDDHREQFPQTYVRLEDYNSLLLKLSALQTELTEQRDENDALLDRYDQRIAALKAERDGYASRLDEAHRRMRGLFVTIRQREGMSLAEAQEAWEKHGKRSLIGENAAVVETSHPEMWCGDCGRQNIVWFAENAVWNRVMGSPSGIVCPACFAIRAERAGMYGVWKLSLHDALEERSASAVEIPVEIPDADATCEHGKRLGELCEPCGDDDDTPLV